MRSTGGMKASFRFVSAFHGKKLLILFFFYPGDLHQCMAFSREQNELNTDTILTSLTRQKSSFLAEKNFLFWEIFRSIQTFFCFVE
jgi:hypothetical protein